MSTKPEMTHRAFSVIKRGEGQDDYWLPVGAAFEHSDGKGYNVILQALPIDGKLVLCVPKSEEEEQRPPPRRDDQREKSGQRGSRPQIRGNAQSRRDNPAASSMI